jgi:mono/diheme cytochrome c family protein
MLSTISLVVAGLSTDHKIGLAAVGLCFIAFALISAFVLPKRDPNFPGKNMPAYIAVSVVFFVAMISAVLIFGRESKGEAAAPATTTSAASPTTTTAPTSTASTSTAPTSTAPTTTTSAAPTTGDPVAGKAVFESAGCTGCHTLKAANATGTIGPNLDQLKPAFATVVHQVENGGGPMPAFKGSLTQTQINDVAAFVYSSTHS